MFGPVTAMTCSSAHAPATMRCLRISNPVSSFERSCQPTIVATPSCDTRAMAGACGTGGSLMLMTRVWTALAPAASTIRAVMTCSPEASVAVVTRSPVPNSPCRLELQRMNREISPSSLSSARPANVMGRPAMNTLPAAGAVIATEGAVLGGASCAPSAAAASSTPHDAHALPSAGTLRAVSMSRCRTSDAVRSGKSITSMAAIPVTCAHAIEVPLR